MRIITLIAFVSMFCFSCSKEVLTGNGNRQTETRKPGSFTAVRNSGSNPVHIQHGEEYKVEIKGSSNLIPAFKSEVSNNTLHLGFERVNVRDNDIEVFITMPKVKEVSLSGSGKLDIAGAFPDQEIFRLRISGSADVTVEDRFNSEEVRADISGSGNANLEKINAQHAEVNISGSGDVRITSEETLKARISGSGKVFYTGNATVNSSISGSGKVIHF
ncbi:head GIN domain-containing protein [Rubrolithibacter danxiaensis]|uniref:head GIN domain-containing protein n=1 Tax=Rubrolithibacter danxiaensis TaxID=3390805 RepID=UPI003BF834EB